MSVHVSKKLFQILAICFLSTLIVSCIKTGQTSTTGGSQGPTPFNEPQPTSTPQPRDQGTVDGGGGNVGGTYSNVSDKDIIDIVEKLPSILKYVFYAHEGFITPYLENKPNISEALKSVYEKLYSNKKSDVFVILEKLKFIAKADGPCKDLNFKEKDGSAFNADKNEICISIPRIKTKIYKSSLLAEVTGLAAHEVSHRVGSNESEATALQEAVVDSFKIKNLEAFEMDMVNRQTGITQLMYAQPYEKFQIFFSATADNKNKIPDTEFCRLANDWSYSIKEFLLGAEEETKKWGVSGVRIRNLVYVSAMSIQMASMLDYCSQESPRCNIPRALWNNGSCGLIDKKSVEEVRTEPFSLSFLNFTTKSWSEGTIKMPGSAMTTYYLDKKAADFNYNQAMSSFKNAIENLDYLKEMNSNP